jgi:ABC-type amino acid transport substrate-binding protein
VTQSGAAVQFVAVADHAVGLAALEQQTADAYASDRIILIGLALGPLAKVTALPSGFAFLYESTQVLQRGIAL